jgi:ABC-2 type transport system ATP-binding protein
MEKEWGNMNAIETINLTKRYGTHTAVKSLNLTVKQGELFALLGVNGAGKTTTIKMLSCLVKPTSGDALMLGDSIVKNTAAVKQKINLSPQETAVAPNLTAKENLELIAGIYGNDKKNAEIKANEMINEFLLNEVADARARTLSGGMQRRLSIAMALISNPKILFLDEPTLGLDVLARRELWRTIEKLKGKITIILTTHYLEETEALADRIGILNKGEIKAIGTVAELKAKTGKEGKTGKETKKTAQKDLVRWIRV